MITINSGQVSIQIHGTAHLLIDDETIALSDGSTATLASNIAQPLFQHVDDGDHESIFWDAIASMGLSLAGQAPDREIEIHVTKAAGDGDPLIYRAWRRFEEGWGVGTEAVLPGPASAPTGTYTVTSLVTRAI